MLKQKKNGYIIKIIKSDCSEKKDEEKDEVKEEEKEEDKPYGGFDDSEDLLNKGEDLINLANYRISHIIIYYDETKELLIGIQLTFRNKKENEIIPLQRRIIDENWNENVKGEHIKLRKKEYICYFSYCVNNLGITQIYFETNKKFIYQKGKEIGEKVELIPFNQKRFDIILGTFGTVKNLGIIYLDIAYYIKLNFAGYSELRMKLNKDKEYQKKIEEKYKDLTEVDKYIYRAALCPMAIFENILKYIIADIS